MRILPISQIIVNMDLYRPYTNNWKAWTQVVDVWYALYNVEEIHSRYEKESSFKAWYMENEIYNEEVISSYVAQKIQEGVICIKDDGSLIFTSGA